MMESAHREGELERGAVFEEDPSTAAAAAAPGLEGNVGIGGIVGLAVTFKLMKRKMIRSAQREGELERGVALEEDPPQDLIFFFPSLRSCRETLGRPAEGVWIAVEEVLRGDFLVESEIAGTAGWDVVAGWFSGRTGPDGVDPVAIDTTSELHAH